MRKLCPECGKNLFKLGWVTIECGYCYSRQYRTATVTVMLVLFFLLMISAALGWIAGNRAAYDDIRGLLKTGLQEKTRFGISDMPYLFTPIGKERLRYEICVPRKPENRALSDRVQAADRHGNTETF